MSGCAKVGWLLLPLAFAQAGSGCSSRQNAAQSQPTQGSAAPSRPAGALPPDVDPGSRNRLPLPRMEELDEDGKRLLAAFQKQGLSITESAPRSIRINSPKVSQYMTKGNQYLRYESGLDPKLREVSILLAARAMDQEYEWAAHEATALKEGLSREVIDIIKHERPVTAAANEKEAAIIRLGREAFNDHHVTPETFAQAQKVFGKKTLVDIVALMGHYAATAILLNVFDQQLDAGQQSTLPPLRRGAATR